MKGHITRARGQFAQVDARTIQILRRLHSPAKIQDFLNATPFNHERDGETYMSVQRALRLGVAHCFEGALIAAAALMYHGHKPLLMDLQTTHGDQDHVVALFQRNGLWGAISKTNHHVLRYRDPVYQNVRELALSYFHEYFLNDGRKTLRAYSDPYDLSRHSATRWLTEESDLIELVNELNDSSHHQILQSGASRILRRADSIEITASEHQEYPIEKGLKK
jgi:hypothetical protein